MLEINQMFLTPNPFSRPQIQLKEVNYIVIHYVGNPGTSALANRNYFENLAESQETYASSHYIIGLEGEIIQCIPENEIAYASNKRNIDSISIENCHPDINGKFNNKTYNSLIQLCADICYRYNIDPEEAVIRHYDVTEKLCPLYYVKNPLAWQQMKEDIKMQLKTIYIR